MADTIREFIVSYAFGVDDASRQRAESATKAAEDRITTANAAALAKRVAQENRTQSDRIAAALKAGQDLNQADRRFVAESEKRRLDAAAAERLRSEGAAKQAQARLEQGYKQAEAQALRLTSLAIKTVAAFDLARLVDRFTVGAFSKLDAAARGFEHLNYVAANTGGSVQGINSVVYALSQLGTSAEDAQSSFINFGNNLSKYKAFEDVLRSMGIATRDMNGQLKDSAILFPEYLEKKSSLPRATREAMNEGWGISVATTQAGSRPELRARIAEYNADQAAVGSDPNAAARDGTAYAQAMRHINSLVDQIKTGIADVLFRTVTPQLEAVAQWLRTNGKTVSDAIAAIASGVERLGASIVQAIAGSNSVKDAMKVVAGAMKTFGDYIGSEQFKKDVRGFVADIVSLAKAVRSALEWIGVLPTRAGDPVVPEAKGSQDVPAQDGPKPDAVAPSASLHNRRGSVRHEYTDFAKRDERLATFGLSDTADDKKAKADIAATAEATRKLADKADGLGGDGGSVGGVSVGETTGGASNLRYGRPDTSGPFRTTPGRHSAGNAGGDHGASGPLGVDYSAKSAQEQMGISKGEWDAFREGVTDIEGKRYDRMGGGGGRYAGRYQMGPAEITATAARLGVPRPSNAQFLADPAMQERFFENYTMDHRRTLMRDPKFAALSAREQLKILGYAHNQGAGGPANSRHGANGAWGYLENGLAGHDGFGTSGAAYPVKIQRRFDLLDRGGTNPPGAGTPPPSAAAVSDAQRFAAQQRILNGSRDPADRALVERYKAEQNVSRPPVPAPVEAPSGNPFLMHKTANDVTTSHRQDSRSAPNTTEPAKVEVVKSNLDADHQKLADAMKVAADKPVEAVQQMARKTDAPEPAKPHLDPAHQKLADAMKAESERHAGNVRLLRAATERGIPDLLMRRHHRPLGDTPALRQQISSVRQGDRTLTHNPTFHITATDPKAALSAAQMVADRGNRDLVRNLSSMEA